MHDHLPKFSTIHPQQITADLTKIITHNKKTLDELLANPTNYSWDNLMAPLDDMEDTLHQYWSRVSHLNAVMNNETLRQAYNQCLNLLSDYYTSISHNETLFQALLSIKNGDEFKQLTPAQQKIIDNEIRDFKLSGVALPQAQKAQFAELTKSLTQLTSQFEENLLDATNAWHHVVTDKNQLEGLPEHAVAAARNTAHAKQCQGWVFTLDMPSYLAVMTYADNRELRETVYRAYITRASDQGPNAKTWDNSTVMLDILKRRLEIAHLLGFNNFAEQSLATKMAESPASVLDFLQQLADSSFAKAQEEFAELSKFAQHKLNIATLAPWDIAYAGEKYRQQHFAISQEDLRPYFPEEQVLNGLFTIVNKLFGITVEEVKNVDIWHPTVKCFALYNSDHDLTSYFYLDLYARPNKRGGAWMDECRQRRRLSDGSIQLPIAFITCNLNPPVNETPALFSHQEVVTLFHEFGHALQHMLTTEEFAGVSGINGIPWDAVELPSQWLENWAWQAESIPFIAQHFQTKETLPDALFERLNKTKNFQAGMMMMRQLEFALFDFKLHLEFSPDDRDQIQNILTQVRQQASVVPVTADNRFQHGFAHIFAGGYAAGYYSYKWAEVMACDAFDLFLQGGIFNTTLAKRFLNNILQPGGSQEPGILFEQLCGRPPQITALLKQSGIQE